LRKAKDSSPNSCVKLGRTMTNPPPADELPDDTLRIALDALIAIENGKLPSDTEVEAMQKTIWAWMHPGRDRSPEAKALFRQGSKLNRIAHEKSITLAAQVEVLRRMDAGSTKSKAVEDYGYAASSEKSKSPERQIYRRTKDMKSPDKLRKLGGAIETAKKALKQRK
jgi:hypothetical protein